MLAVKRSKKLWALTDKGTRQVRADWVTSLVEGSGWVRCSVGDGSKGLGHTIGSPSILRPLKEPGKGHWLLARRSVAKPGELAYYVCFGTVEITLEELVRVAGIR